MLRKRKSNNFTAMKKHVTTKVIISALLVIAVNITFASFTGKNDDHASEKFSLKNLNNYTKNYYTLSTLKTQTFQFKNSLELVQQKKGNTVEVQSMIRMQQGNTTYVYPYRYQVKVPLQMFKTPTAPSLR